VANAFRRYSKRFLSLFLTEWIFEWTKLDVTGVKDRIQPIKNNEINF
jgi:hypothetical protein